MTRYARVAILLAVDALAVNVSYIFSYLARFDFNADSESFLDWFSAYGDNMLALSLIKVAVFVAFGLYNSLWRYAGAEEIARILAAMAVGVFANVTFLGLSQQSMPRSIVFMTYVVDVFLIGGSRLIYRAIRGVRLEGFHFAGLISAKSRLGLEARLGDEGARAKVMVFGAGDAGASMIKEIKSHPEHGKRVVVAMDDAPYKRGKRIVGVKIAGGRGNIRQAARRYGVDEIIIAIPSASKKVIQEIVNECKKTKCKLRILPGLGDLINEKVSINKLRDVDIEDLLGREPVRVNLREISGYLEGRIVMVTGGGGSIGSELCRQIARFRPRRLIAVDIYENSVFDLSNEMSFKFPALEFEAVIGSVRSKGRMRETMAKYKPHVVFHAAAHKHVPLMELNPREAIVNNVLGTANMVDLAEEHAVDKFVMISTDKAVNPTNVMGATKRVAEMIVQEKCRTARNTHYAVVRFGNVLGSNGSVIPLFRKQIENGGPVTVTHPDITRYFMTIPEAVQLVIQAGALAEGGEIFILDMGEQIRIMDLAENLIRLSGYAPHEDIEIKITQLRPGEKLHEELALDGEEAKATRHEKIFVGKPLPPSEDLSKALNGGRTLEEIIYGEVAAMTDGEAKEWLRRMAPAYVIKRRRPETRGVLIGDEE
ncbi:MAG: polysaccharide biosynthesis protein [Clostridiales Family XIII bacterium]|jgi:FlaA1/EpsC-like NDP-sugar epimerase|nr:polysaccharide biosynthesis protein [Clostridiales Family XIII bacterium]